jgi:hypothetical protein
VTQDAVIGVEEGDGAETQASSAPATAPSPPARVLEGAARQINKATLVPLELPADEQPRHGLVKSAFVRGLGLRAGEVDAVRELGGVPGGVLDLLARHPEQSPPPGELAAVAVPELQAFGRALIAVREGCPDTEAALAGLAINTAQSPLGMLNLERLEMTPAGVERGELVATIPLAPLEETSVVEKEWSLQSKEFTSIVTDELEEFSETGVTDTTELAQSTSSQQEHSNQFNITGTVSGGIPVISGSASSGFTSQDSASKSANESRNHSKTLTQKASARAKQEHKVTISTKSVVGKEETSTRWLRNSSASDPIRIDYYSLMRKWRVRLYRYGLRLTYDIVIPEPGAAMRRAYRELERLKRELGPFTFNVSHSEITDEILPGETQPHFLVLADRYGAQNIPYPPAPEAPRTYRAYDGGTPKDRFVTSRSLDLPPGYEIVDVTIAGRMTRYADTNGRFTIEGTTLPFVPFGGDEKAFDPPEVLRRNTDSGLFLEGATGSPVVIFFWDEVAVQSIELIVRLKPSKHAMDQWRAEVWNALFNAAQTTYFARQQDAAAQIAALEERLRGVDTLTLRREESDEIMKGVIRFIAGAAYRYMDKPTSKAFLQASEDIAHGIGFTANKLGLTETAFAAVAKHENTVRFINQAIEWENVVTFLYSYFWDAPEGWEFVRNLQHPDAGRQAFLRAGSARVVLTVRKGWEEAWMRFAESGFTDPCHNPGQPYLSIAREIAFYDDRNYPGIPPANPGRAAARTAESVVTTASESLSPSARPVTIRVESNAGFVAGATVVIGTAGIPNTQEAQQLQAVLGNDRLVVRRLDNPHDGTGTPIPIVWPGEKGALIAEWNEYTPNSGTDIAVGSPPGVVADA